jgi:hypothetical protein
MSRYDDGSDFFGDGVQPASPPMTAPYVVLM